MDIFEIEGELRHDRGKGASRRLRRAGKLPAIVYGGHKDPTAIQVTHTEMLLHTEHEAFYSHILNLKIDGKTERVVLKDMQRHPYKPFIMHMDFLRVSESEAITIRVPLHFVNEDRCVGVKQGGGVISHLMADLEVTCLPRDLPEYIEVDLQNINLGESIHLSELELPKGVEITSVAHGGDADQAVVSVHAPRGGASDAEGEEEGGEEGAEG
ncbi:MAG: 50S ribosomal protein L25/general stress protein Ctc [Gammaproteobacteria bacterium]|nr:50S ribosomal protein L25/general stress protein Ctc [Gammaproteobacteria bacterium]MCP5200435.1 50S ribosomal protein L25/general stress protein Ctc [Gammaproteobacteria bacterium]